jgi:hypothetical protein
MKRWWRSKTIWVQLITAAIGGLEAAQIVQVVPEGYAGALFLALAGLNAALRFMTREPVR